MTRRCTVDHERGTRRRAAREAEHGRELAESSHAWMSPELTLEERELEALHDEIMADIPQACLRAYVMVRGDDAPYEAVAARLGVSREAVSSNVRRAQRRIRQRLKEHDIHAPSRYKRREEAVWSDPPILLR
jgi:DNA-directed RNA polymerase specialized sigma24 family protein